jgi:hypothetical protein
MPRTESDIVIELAMRGCGITTTERHDSATRSAQFPVAGEQKKLTASQPPTFEGEGFGGG